MPIRPIIFNLINLRDVKYLLAKERGKFALQFHEWGLDF